MSTMQLILNRQHNGYWKENKTWKRSSGKRRKSYMKELRFLDELVQRYPVLEPVKGDILKAYEIMRDCYERAGN